MSQDFNKMMRDAQKSIMKAQQDMAQMQKELDAMRIEGTSGGGAVTMTCSGNFEFTKVKISKDAIDPEDVETLEDLVLAAIKDAIGKVQQIAAQRAASLTSDLKLPPGMGF
jgi:DNA-binding YbaB/EbfC family protein